MDLTFTLLTADAKIPTRKFPTDAGLDFYSSEDTKVSPLGFAIVHTGVAIKLPEKCVGQIWPKSRSNFLIGGGIIDENYQGEILVKIANLTVNEVIINKGDAIAQLIIVPVVIPLPVVFLPKEIFYKSTTDRGTTGGIVSQTEKFIEGYSQLDMFDPQENEGSI